MKPFKYLIVVLTVMTAASALAGVRTDVQMRSAASRVLKSSRPLEKVAYYPGMALYRKQAAVLPSFRATTASRQFWLILPAVP